jgi:hypothetical protein
VLAIAALPLPDRSKVSVAMSEWAAAQGAAMLGCLRCEAELPPRGDAAALPAGYRCQQAVLVLRLFVDGTVLTEVARGGARPTASAGSHRRIRTSTRRSLLT